MPTDSSLPRDGPERGSRAEVASLHWNRPIRSGGAGVRREPRRVRERRARPDAGGPGPRSHDLAGELRGVGFAGRARSGGRLAVPGGGQPGGPDLGATGAGRGAARVGRGRRPLVGVRRRANRAVRLQDRPPPDVRGVRGSRRLGPGARGSTRARHRPGGGRPHAAGRGRGLDVRSRRRGDAAREGGGRSDHRRRGWRRGLDAARPGATPARGVGPAERRRRPRSGGDELGGPDLRPRG